MMPVGMPASLSAWIMFGGVAGTRTLFIGTVVKDYANSAPYEIDGSVGRTEGGVVYLPVLIGLMDLAMQLSEPPLGFQRLKCLL